MSDNYEPGEVITVTGTKLRVEGRDGTKSCERCYFHNVNDTCCYGIGDRPCKGEPIIFVAVPDPADEPSRALWQFTDAGAKQVFDELREEAADMKRQVTVLQTAARNVTDENADLRKQLSESRGETQEAAEQWHAAGDECEKAWRRLDNARKELADKDETIELQCREIDCREAEARGVAKVVAGIQVQQSHWAHDTGGYCVCKRLLAKYAPETMNFTEAIRAVAQGQAVRRMIWAPGIVLTLDSSNWAIQFDDTNATDWVIVREPSCPAIE